MFIFTIDDVIAGVFIGIIVVWAIVYLITVALFKIKKWLKK